MTNRSRRTGRSRVLLCALLLAVMTCLPAFAGLLEYVAKPEPDYSWSKIGEQSVAGARVIDLAMTSQVWEGIPWKHTIRVYIPATLTYPDAVLLVIAGGNPGGGDLALGPTISGLIGAPVAILYNIPNQPLFDRNEDALIAYTFVKYLETGDPDWPLLLPMTKSAVKAMDTLQAFAREQYQREINTFVVTGASKRGWTTWLTGAVESDRKRVKGIAPMVIDTLNIPAQMRHQMETWGFYSEQIEDYTKLGLQKETTSAAGESLMKLVDPYSFRDRITMPKLIINGANDRYWVTDALNTYWGGLAGPKWVLYVPNSGHGLEDTARVFNSLSAFFRTIAADKTFPDMTWKYEEAEGNVKLTISALPRPSEARVWVVHSPSLDFRDQKWESTPMQAEGDAFSLSLPKPHDDNMAVFGEADFDMGGRGYTLSTQVRIVPKS